LFAPITLAAKLTLKVQGHENKLGQLHIAISRVNGKLNDDLLWDGLESVSKLIKDVDPEQNKKNTVQLIIEDLPIGLICIRLYMDLNDNQLLERSAIGLPMEPVGFSNNPSLFKGEPTPRDSCFLLEEKDNVHTVKLKQHKKRKRKSKLGVTIN
jgi:uncharacterized protein (DUF2141 family)